MKKKAVLFIAALIVAISVTAVAQATPEKAKQTGKQCKECHPNAGPHANWYHK